MTRRAFVSIASAAALSTNSTPLLVPLREITDRRSPPGPDQLRRFHSILWPEALRDFSRCGIRFRTSELSGAVRVSPGGRPVLEGLDPAAINLVLTDHIPPEWDSGRALAGFTARYDGITFCMLALRFAHGHQAPYFSVNTCVHELLHVFTGDILEHRPEGWRGARRETRIDWYATNLWLFHDCAPVRQAVGAWLARAAVQK